VKEGPTSTSLFGDFQWLSFFHSDRARLVAVAMVCVTVVAIFCVRPLAEVWKADRLNQRSHERRKLALASRIENEIEQRRKGRLDLDA
jgi:hypothetical protein